MRLERHQQVMHGAGPVRYRDDQAHAVLTRGWRRAQCLRQTDHREARAIEGIVLNRVRSHMQTKFATGAFTGNGGPSGVGGSQTCALGVAGCALSFGIWQVSGEPVLTLGQRLRMTINHFDIVEHWP